MVPVNRGAALAEVERAPGEGVGMSRARQRAETGMSDGVGGKHRRDMGTLACPPSSSNGLMGAGIFGLPEVLHQAVGQFAPWLLLIGGHFRDTPRGRWEVSGYNRPGPIVYV